MGNIAAQHSLPLAPLPLLDRSQIQVELALFCVMLGLIQSVEKRVVMHVLVDHHSVLLEHLDARCVASALRVNIRQVPALYYLIGHAKCAPPANLVMALLAQVVHSGRTRLLTEQHIVSLLVLVTKLTPIGLLPRNAPLGRPLMEALMHA